MTHILAKKHDKLNKNNLNCMCDVRKVHFSYKHGYKQNAEEKTLKN